MQRPSIVLSMKARELTASARSKQGLSILLITVSSIDAAPFNRAVDESS